MIRRFIKKLLAPIVREVVEEIKISEKKDLKLLEDVVQGALLRAVNHAPIVREVVEEIKVSEKKDLKSIEDVVQGVLLRAVNQINVPNL